MLNKPLEYWAVIVGMVLYAAAQKAEAETLYRRVAKIAASAALAIGTTPSLAPYTRGSEIFAAVIVMGMGIIILDLVVALLGDRKFIKDLIAARFGGGSDNG